MNDQPQLVMLAGFLNPSAEIALCKFHETPEIFQEHVKTTQEMFVENDVRVDKSEFAGFMLNQFEEIWKPAGGETFGTSHLSGIYHIFYSSSNGEIALYYKY